MAEKMRAAKTFSRAGKMVPRGTVLTVGKDLSAAEARLLVRDKCLVPHATTAPKRGADRRVSSGETVKRDGD